VVAKPGAGKVAAAGDSSLWEDATPKYKKETDGTTKSTHDGWTDSDHDTLAINLVNWLATPDPTPGIDPALQQAPTPEPYDVFTLTEPLSEPWANPPSGYKWYDSTTFKAGAYGAPGGGTTPPTTGEAWQWESIALNAYPNNNLALFLDVQGLTPGGTSTNQAYVYVTGGSPLIGRRYNRTTGTYATGTDTTSNQQTLPVAADGTIQRWEFWQLTNATSARTIVGRIRVGSTNKATTPSINQKPTSGTYGYLKVESSLGYSDGLHAALFTAGSTLDTAVQILKNTDTTVTLAPGSYTLAIQDDTTVKRTGVSVTITAGQTVSLASLLEGGGGNPNAGFTFSAVPENSYPGNRLAIYLDGHDLAAGGSYSTDAFLSASGSGQAISRRYNRSTGTFASSATQSLTADGAGEVHRWEFWDLDQVTSPRALNAHVRLNGTETDSRELTQAAGGTYGYLTVEASLGYADGLHAALFTAGSTLDTAVWLSGSGDTTITLPPGTYTLEIRNDTAAERSGIPMTIAEGQTVSLSQLLNGGGQPQPGWSLSSVPAHAYPGNRLALLLDGNGLPANKAYSTKAYVYVTGPGTQISKRYNRSTGTFVDGLTAQNLTTDSQGQLHRWEFWELTSSGDRGISARLTIDGTKKATENLQQVKTGSFGYLTIPASLGYSDGLHAALFTVDGALDTTAWIVKNSDTTITLPAGTYTVAIWDDAGAVVTDLPVTITAGRTVSLANAFDQTPPVITAERTPANDYGWNNDDVTVTFACDDAESGVASCSDAITLTDEGRGQRVTGTATDNAGNTASITVSGINIDRTAPVVTFTGARTYGVDETVSITCTASDALAGLVENPCAAPLAAGPAHTFGVGTHSLTVSAEDKAGNRTEVSVEFTVMVTYRSLSNLTRQMLAADKGVANALAVKLAAAEKAVADGNTEARDGALGAYVNEVQAQAGKKLTAEQAALLESLATALMNQQ
ncbi:MAG TPA: hypothetical protein VK464_09710, partial [Symbiobacteriaceae bacterium]|nr:hypothetical protein [Symbiobacteriaceae bacterium]